MTLQPSASVIASFNLKGGVGKTHVCWLLASVCIERGKRCLIVELDQQPNKSAEISACPQQTDVGAADSRSSC